MTLARPDPFHVADCLLDEWESAENETFRDGHRSTLRRLIAEAFIEIDERAWHRGFGVAVETAAQLMEDWADVNIVDEQGGFMTRAAAIRALDESVESKDKP